MYAYACSTPLSLAAGASLVGLRPEGKEAIWHGFNVPDLGRLLVEGIFPLPSKIRGNIPAQFVVSKSHAYQVAALLSSLTIDKAFAAMQNCEVVDEVNVTRPGTDLQLSRFGNVLDGVQSFHLAWGNGGEIARSWVDRIPCQGYPPEVHNHSSVMVEEDRTALEARPIPASQVS